IDMFNSSISTNWFVDIFKGSPAAYWNQFTNENVIFLRDINEGLKKDVYLTTRYLVVDNTDMIRSNDIFSHNIGDDISSVDYKNVYNNGNLYYKTKNYKPSGTAFGLLNKGAINICDVWISVLSNYTTLNNDFYNIIINYTGNTYNPKLSALILLSNFGYALSPYNYYPRNLNQIVFNTPAAIEVPA